MIFGSTNKIIQGAGRKGSDFKGSRDPGTPPYGSGLGAIPGPLGHVLHIFLGEGL